MGKAIICGGKTADESDGVKCRESSIKKTPPKSLKIQTGSYLKSVVDYSSVSLVSSSTSSLLFKYIINPVKSA